MEYHSTYKGCNIYRSLNLGHGLKWTSYVDGLFVSADTLTGIRKMIKGGMK